MFFEDLNQIPELILASDFAVFVIPARDFPPEDRILTIAPDEKHTIAIDQVRSAIQFASNKTSSAQIIYLHYPEKLTEAAENALLKLLEEPAPNLHIAFFTEHLSSLLPTTRSRAKIFMKKSPLEVKSPPVASPEVIQLAKQLIASQGPELVKLAETLASVKPPKSTKVAAVNSPDSLDLPRKNPKNTSKPASSTPQKSDTRAYVLQITAAAIEILYKTYFITKNPVFLQKLPKMLKLHANLRANGHIKLHIVADLC